MIEFFTQIGVPDKYAGDLWLLIIFLITGIILLALVNKKSLGALILSIYAAYAIVSFAYFLPEKGNTKVMFFGLFIFFSYMLLKKVFSFSIKGKKVEVLAQTLVLSLLAVGLIGSLVMEWIHPNELELFFTPFSKKLFFSDMARFIWPILPLAALFAFKKNKR
ncbi:MAG: hypothetical protein U5L10_01355 [Candidatus Moranbacteria bacterium]|nr:hypothetical protein [Candidatus Moranbacteria bacterium]